MKSLLGTDIVFGSTKTYTAITSTAFRQPAANSHRNQNHGYGLSWECVFESEQLDHRNWVVDFGGLKTFKNWLETTFDHTTVIAEDDPHRDWYEEGHCKGILTPVYVKTVGCESFSLLAFEKLEQWLYDNNYSPRVWLQLLRCSEHQGNSAYVRRK